MAPELIAVWIWKPNASSHVAAKNIHSAGMGAGGMRRAGGASRGGSSIQRSATTATIRPTLASTNGTRGEDWRSAAVSIGASAPASPMPNIDQEISNGVAERSRRRAMMTIGGARNADEVAAQSAVSPTSSAGEVAAGSSTKATPETTEIARIQTPSRCMALAMRSAAMPMALSAMTKIA